MVCKANFEMLQLLSMSTGGRFCLFHKHCSYMVFLHFLFTVRSSLVPRPSSKEKRRGGSGEYSTHYGLAVAMESAKSQAFEVSCWASVNCAK